MKPITRKEIFMNALANGVPAPIEPQTREEILLAQQAQRESEGGGGEDKNLFIIRGSLDFQNKTATWNEQDRQHYIDWLDSDAENFGKAMVFFHDVNFGTNYFCATADYQNFDFCVFIRNVDLSIYYWSINHANNRTYMYKYTLEQSSST